MATTLHQNAADHMAGKLGSGNMEQYIAINAGCSALIAAIAKTVTAIHGLMREVRESRADLDPISSELHSLNGILDILKDDVPSLPEQLAQSTPEVLSYCLTIINELQGCISILDRVGLSRQDKKSRWMASRGHIAKLRWTLEVYKASLGLAVDLVALTSSKQQSEESPVRGTFMVDSSVVWEGKDELADVLAQISRVAARLEDESRHNGAVAKLQHYLDALYGNALAAVDREMDHFEGQRNSAHSSTDNAPDSAIDMGDDDHAFVHAKTSNIPIPQTHVNMTQDEFDEMLDELREMPVRPPTPPQRSARRSSSAASVTRSEYRPSTSDSHTTTPYVAGTFLDLETRSQSPHLRTQSDSAAISPRTVPINHFPHMSGGVIPVRTYGQNRDSLWENPRPAVPVPRPTTSSSNITNSPKPNVLRRSSSRLSSALKGLSFGRQRSHSTTSTSSAKSSTPSLSLAFGLTSTPFATPFSMAMPPSPRTPTPASEAPASQPVSIIPPSGAIFGVSLADSMSVAKGLAGTRHDSGGSSTRDYPLCILRCVYFIQDHGLRAPHIFAQEGDAYRLQRLKAIFSSPETGYGKFLDWNQFTVYEAADLILLFLSELPQPLVPESVAKRWISMSRQATMSGSSAIRLDKGIDFWEEALQGIKGPNRSLFKLLLNLWGDVADSEDWNEMTAERLAERMMRPLMHLPQTRYGTDYMLGLAFVVRKRSEYNAGLKGERSRAAF